MHIQMPEHPIGVGLGCHIKPSMLTPFQAHELQRMTSNFTPTTPPGEENSNKMCNMEPCLLTFGSIQPPKSLISYVLLEDAGNRFSNS